MMIASKFIVLYGSETGTSQDVAERIWREIKLWGLKGGLSAMDDYSVTNLPSENLAVFVCSTTGQGDPPSNMRNFWKFLLRRNLPLDSLSNLKFAVLGLGDSSYSKFNYTGKKLWRRLEMLGGRSILAPGWADDQHDLGPDAVVDPWISSLLHELSLIYPEMNQPVDPPPLISKWKVHVDKSCETDERELQWPLSSNALNVKVAFNLRTTPIEHFQEVRLIRLETDGAQLKYQCGDVAVVRPSNSVEAVKALFEVLSHLDPSTVVTLSQRDEDMPVPSHLQSPVSLKQLVTHYWDLNAVPRRSTLEILSRLEGSSSPDAEMEREKLVELSSSAGQEDYFAYCTRPRRTIVELLQDFPHTSSSLTSDFLFDVFQPIRPRMFSIASPPQVKYVELLVAVVKYKTRLHKPRMGLCSNWLASLENGQLIQLDIRSGTLTFPKQNNLIMIGPGTGVAPFRSFICSVDYENLILENETKLSNKDVSCLVNRIGDAIPDFTNLSTPSVTLVFGCRNRASDFHFKDDFVGKPGLKLLTAFSRDQPHKIYVQNIIAEEGEYFGRMLTDSNTCVMVAGNSKEMPEAVWKAFASSILKAKPSLTMSDAESLLQSLENKGLYQTETWS